MGLAERKRRFPDEPWRWKAAWSTGTIVDGTRGDVFATWAIALFWNAISTPALVAVFHGRHAQPPWWAYAAVCFLSAAGVGIVCVAIYQTLRVAHFGRSELTLEPFPAHPGEPLNATVRVHVSLRDVTAVVAKLQCVRRERRGSGKNESTVNTVLWHDDRPASTVDENGETRIRATFAPPADARVCDNSNRRDVLLWQLIFHGDRPGVDYGATFDLPMFARRPNDATPPATPFATGVLPPAATGLPIDELAAQRIRVRPLAGRGFTVEFPAARRVALASLFTLFAEGCDAIAIFAAKPGGMFGPFERSFAGARNAMFMVVFTLVFGLIGLASTWVATTMWLARTTVTADRDGLSITRSVLGLSRRRTLASGEITSIAPKQTMSSGSRVFYAIEITKPDGNRDLLGSGIECRSVADRLAAAMGEAMR